MHAGDLLIDFPVVDLDASANSAARFLAEQSLTALIVLDSTGGPHTVLPGSQVLRFLIPTYIQEDVNLAGVLDDEAVAEICGRLRGKTVRDVLPRSPQPLPAVQTDATPMEVAAVMARMHSPVVAVLHERRYVGAITAARLLDVLLPRA